VADYKKIQYFGDTSGQTIYGMIMRCSDSAFLDTDSHFRETPTSPYKAFTEKTVAGVLSKIYEFSNNTDVWANGYYYVFIYLQAGGAPAINTDTMLQSGTLLISGDSIVQPAFSFASV
jgi:hypothetical protein